MNDVLPLLLTGVTAGLSLAVVLVPVVVRLAAKRLEPEQLRLIYDMARSAHDVLEVVAPQTSTTLDDRLEDVVSAVEENLGRELRKRERSVVQSAVRKAAARATSLSR